MKEIDKTVLFDKIKGEAGSENFNIYEFVAVYLSKRK